MEALRWRAEHHGSLPAGTFLRDGETAEATWSYAELDRRARAVAAGLLAEGARGERALLFYPSGLEFLAAFLGCLYAGIVAIPAPFPRPGRKDSRLSAIVTRVQPRFALTTTPSCARLENTSIAPLPPAPRLLCTDTMLDDAEGASLPSPAPGDLAFLQYTSGSISQPKGVMVSHGNLVANHRMLQTAFGQGEQPVIVLWLPLFHDMGLIGNALQAIFVGGHAVMMTPEAFLVKPVRWLQAVSRWRAHTSGGPNFAFEHCVRRITAEQKQGLDLSTWRVAFNGAEPVRAETMERFAEAFAPCGFQHESLYPCYGLAEATLFATGGSPSTRPVTVALSASALSRGRAETPADPRDLRFRVSCGHPWGGGAVQIVDPETGLPCEEDRVGEIWLGGLHVAAGYWNSPEATRETFGACLPGEQEARWLRTGDLGFQRGGELFVTGRLKELIIIAGRNHYPRDLEHTAESAHPSVVPGGAVAFAVETELDEQLVLLAEIERHPRAGADRAKLEAAIRQAVVEEHGLQLHALIFLLPASLPKTSSGKLRRSACAEAYAQERLAAFLHPHLQR